MARSVGSSVAVAPGEDMDDRRFRIRPYQQILSSCSGALVTSLFSKFPARPVDDAITWWCFNLCKLIHSTDRFPFPCSDSTGRGQDSPAGTTEGTDIKQMLSVLQRADGSYLSLRSERSDGPVDNQQASPTLHRNDRKQVANGKASMRLGCNACVSVCSALYPLHFRMRLPKSVATRASRRSGPGSGPR